MAYGGIAVRGEVESVRCLRSRPEPYVGLVPHGSEDERPLQGAVGRKRPPMGPTWDDDTRPRPEQPSEPHAA
jgi:hypothetical protein